MSTPIEGLDLPALERFFAERVPGFTGELTATLLAGGRSNLTYLLTDGQGRWVLRRPPLGGLTPSAHDVLREHRVVEALSDSEVPVARAIAHDSGAVIGAPFSLVEHVAGPVIRTEEQLHALAQDDIDRCAHALVDVLARLHALAPEKVGLGDFGRPQGYVGRQIRRWYDQWQRVHTRDLPDIDALHAGLAEAQPAEGDASIVHGDFRIDNVILAPEDPGTIRAVVDWEMSTLGDPLADLGVHIVYSDPAFAHVLAGSAASTSPRLPGTEATARRYAETTGRDLSDFPFYLALGYFKVAVIAEGIYARFLAGVTRGDGFEGAGAATAPLAAAGLRALSGNLERR
ncbi:Predicted kinase, aminoglycoside phosphotransferase (APT) family [Parafrankia irregularis]|uniref:Predicted kinase, aminoglycoside phosphotransferase (APT) family n=1 Tax=Parafrankia irregularis TaxID=795642 RepID=A0A0S4QMN0_9ACTN|nr:MULTISPECIES: phosphotransferase family protein [Parafrankia]MBE3200591.1 phosphotransferase family protein [Parafrankia sp. CH37]CUU56923.1 Predicted kinase, aminoglycoside phosphotransferase (APT) family [Parafrankia irregularis]